ncbi:MAG: DUF4105 domain-containing protein [Archangium sp.]
MLHALTLLIATTSAQQLPPWMTGESQPEDITVSLITFSPGDSLVEWWGHTAFVIEDRKLNKGLVYNFGMFGPRMPGDDVGFVKDFIKGRLIFWVAHERIDGTFGFYKDVLKRDVRIQELDLDPAEAMAIAKRLGTHVLPDNMYYRYHHYDDNCSTRPRDIIDEVIGGQLKAATSAPSSMTFRQHTLRYSRVDPPMSLVLDYLQGPRIDRPITGLGDAYLPDELEKQVQALQVKRADGSVRPLVKRQYKWFDSQREPPPATPPNWIPYELIVGALLGGLAHLLGHLARDGKKSWRVLLGLYTALNGLLLGILGIALFFLMFFTDHDVTYGNWNLLQASPVHFALFPLGLMFAFGNKRAPTGNRITWWIAAAMSVIGLIALPFTLQANGNILAILVPLNLGFASMWFMAQRYKPAAAPAPAK